MRNFFIFLKDNILLIILIIVFFSVLGYEQNKYRILTEAHEKLTLSYEDSQKKIAQLKKEQNDLVMLLQDFGTKNQQFANQLTQVTQSYNQLQWISSLDPQLLQKYSKVYFLNENYVPANLSAIDNQYLFNKNKSIEFHQYALPFLHNMLKAAQDANVPMSVASAYRSFKEQTSLKSGYKVIYGTGANSFSAEQGYSEHQLGTAVDLTTTKVGGALTGFEKSPSYTWMQENAYKYGFILSYPQNNKYYVFEPWHWRFVGVSLALKLHNENKNLFDVDQREINTYLGGIFSATVVPPTEPAPISIDQPINGSIN